MLGLVEKPGKDGHHRSRSDRSNLISVGNGETGFDYDYYDIAMAPEPLDLSSVRLWKQLNFKPQKNR